MNQLASSISQGSHLEDSLSILNSLQFENCNNLYKTLSTINNEVCRSLSIDRCGIWLFDHSKTELRCEDIFDAKQNKHFSGLEISLSNSPFFLHLVRSNRVYSVSNVEEIDYLEEFSNRHLATHDIKAIISSGLNVKGELVGIFAGSVIGSAYNWQSIDRLYFSSAADIVSRIFTRITDLSHEPSIHKISLRKLVKELSSLCSQASQLPFRTAAKKGLESISTIIGASRTHAIVIEPDKTYALCNREDSSLSVNKELAHRIHLLVSNSHPIWIQDTSAVLNELPEIFSGLGLLPSHAALICPFGTLEKESKDSIRGVIITEFRHPAPIWNDGLREVLLSASDAFSILSKYAYAKLIHMENAELARAAFQSSSIGMVIFSDTGEILRLNESFSQMVHAPPNEQYQPLIGSLIPSLKKGSALFKKILSWSSCHNLEFEEEIIGPDGFPHWKLITISNINLPNQNARCFTLQAIDITQRKKALLELDNQRTFFRTVIDTSPNYVFAKDIDGIFRLANQAFANAYGTTVKNMIGKRDEDFNKDKKQVERFRKDDLYVLRNNKELHKIEEVVTTANDGLRYLQTVKRPICDSSGKPFLVLGVSTDITERKQSEEKNREWLQKLEHTQKLESLGILASGIAHDFNNLLLGITGNSALAVKHIDANNPAHALINKSITASKRAAELTSQLLAYSGKGTCFTKKIDLTEAVRETAYLLEGITAKKGSLYFSVNPEPLFIKADSSQLQQIIMNLITNAVDAIERPNGLVHVKTYLAQLSESPPDLVNVSINETQISGEYAVLEIADNGCGISKDIIRNIFDPFFTTKFTGRGLGLASVMGIICAHRALLCLTSTPKKGSSFKVYFPIFKGLTNSISNNKLNDEPKSIERVAGGTVLLIEDDKIASEVSGSMLKDIGFSVVFAKDGLEGVTILKQHPGKFSAILLDLTMPRMDGSEALPLIRKINNNIPVIVISGYSEKGVRMNFQNNEISGFIQKPFLPETLRKALIISDVIKSRKEI